MNRKPTYEELFERIKELEQESLERHYAEEELQKGKGILNTIIDSLPFDVFALDPSNRYFLQNSICVKNWGNVIGKCPKDLPVNKETINLWMDNNRRALSGETVADEVEYHGLDGKKYFYHNIVAPIRDEDKIFGILGVLVNISELKQAEEALRESEKRNRRLVETMNDGIGIQDENGLITYVNNKFCQMLDYKKDDLIGKPVTNFLDDHNRQILINQISDRKKGKVKPYEIEWTCKDGSKIQTIMSPQAIFSDNGQFKGSFSVITDISTLKQTEKLLQESKERFRNLTEITSDWIWEVDKDACYTYVSPKIYDILGYDPEEIIGKTPFDLMPPAEANRLSKIFDNIAASKRPFDCLENINLQKDGHPVVLETSGIPILDAVGEFLGYRGIDRDITERKRVEEALRESEERYRSLAENSRIGFWQTTLDGHTIYINPAMCQMLEIEESEELHGKTYDSFYDDENREIIKHELAKREKGISSTYEVELIGRKGTKRNVMISGAPIFLSEDKIHSAIGTFTDITDKKRVETALMKAHNELEHRVKKRTSELEIKTKNLEEINIVMKVLLKKRDEDKKDIEDNVLTNVKELIAPFFKKIKKTKLDDQQKTFLSIIESNINEIISPFTRKMSLKYLNLTPTEIRIANLIRHGSPTKEIAELLNLSPRTVETHRKNIRRKIGLEGKRANLRSHLLSLQ